MGGRGGLYRRIRLGDGRSKYVRKDAESLGAESLPLTIDHSKQMKPPSSYKLSPELEELLKKAEEEEAKEKAARAKKRQKTGILDFREAEEAHEYFRARSDSWYDTLTKDMRADLALYTGHGFRGLNEALRDEGKNGTLLSMRYAQMQIRLNAALKKFEINESIVLYRGARVSCIPKFAREDPSKLVGKIYYDNGFMSCGASEESGWPHEPVHFVITVPKGSTGAGAYIGEHSSCPEEGEFLLRSNSHFTVTGASKSKDGIITINMTLIPGKYNLEKGKA